MVEKNSMNKMANVFYTKKAKAKMRERRRKKEKADDVNEGGGAASDGLDGSGSQSGRKRSADQMSSGGKRQPDGGQSSSHDVHSKRAKTSTKTITVPAHLTAKEAKKFRKDERRKARAEGVPDDQVKFVVEGQEHEQGEEEEQSSKADGGKKKSAAAKKKEFPRINDLLSQHAEQRKLEEKLSKQRSANDKLPSGEKGRYVAIDCEMVGVGSDGSKSALARASVVDWDGKVLLDTFVRVPERVTDFRTRVSGVRPKDIKATNEDAMDPDECRAAVGKLLMNKILVGHALKNDLSALMLTHPRRDIRDTARYKPFMRPSGRGGGKLRPRKLRDLVHENLGMRIQVEGEAHCSIDDARASMELFKVVKGRWEKELAGSGGKKGGGKK